MIRFVTLFPKCGNVQLVKDVAQLPNALAEYGNIEAFLVNCQVDLSGSNCDQVQNLHLEQIRMLFNNPILTGFVYILLHSKKIDWLNIYHCDRKTLYWSRLYKFLNPKGRVYVKLDMDFRFCDCLDQEIGYRNKFRKVSEIADILSVENQCVKDRISQYTDKEIMLVENGCCISDTDLKCNAKENILLTVGRLGTEQKATEILLEAFARTADRHDWKLVLVGSIESSFRSYISDYFERYRELKERVQFTGAISSRERICEFYARAKVFVLPSRWESFGLALLEALCYGCSVVVSDACPSAEAVTDCEQFGKVVPVGDVEALSSAILDMTGECYESEKVMKIAAYGRERFFWGKNVKALYGKMMEFE